MAGRGRFDEVSPIENKDVFVLRNGIFRPMHLPVNFDRFFSGVCLAESFADAYQKEMGVEVDAKATKADIIAAIEAK